ncbi:thioredoxin [mine drainage metagenome]|uniref:Thioredoxin n=1 Tax=mine drainage metagenome TaxID=410659 RepID=A0A1J5RZR3_9ZZZZ
MSKKIIFFGLATVAAILIFSFIPEKHSDKNEKNNNGIQFIESDWNKALQEAKKQNKLVFLDAYASWCGPCKLLKSTTFRNKEAGEFFNSNFINVAVDMEKGDGPALLEKFGVTAFPTLIIADADGNIVTYTMGYMGHKELIDFGKHGLTLKSK